MFNLNSFYLNPFFEYFYDLFATRLLHCTYFYNFKAFYIIFFHPVELSLRSLTF